MTMMTMRIMTTQVMVAGVEGIAKLTTQTHRKGQIQILISEEPITLARLMKFHPQWE
jgi:hypothetical protein